MSNNIDETPKKITAIITSLSERLSKMEIDFKNDKTEIIANPLEIDDVSELAETAKIITEESDLTRIIDTNRLSTPKKLNQARKIQKKTKPYPQC